MKVMQGFVRIWDLVVDVIVALAGILLWGQMIVVNIEVCARYVGRPTTWAAEISSLLVLWIPFMVAAWVLRNDGHVKMDLVVERLSASTQAMISIITSLIGIVVMLIVAWAGLMATINSIGTRTPTMLMLPKAPMIGIIFVGSLMLAIQFVIRASTDFSRWKAKKSEGRLTPEKVGSAF
jgi:TRAP-type C4-dicarboxylate transport system permease small subunit